MTHDDDDTGTDTSHEAAADPGALAGTYFRCWQQRDFATLCSILADDVTFRGPLGSADDAETCVTGLRGMRQIVTDIAIRHMWVQGAEVLTWFDLHTSVAAPVATANWSSVEGGKITRIRVTFDARALAAGLSG